MSQLPTPKTPRHGALGLGLPATASLDAVRRAADTV